MATKKGQETRRKISRQAKRRVQASEAQVESLAGAIERFLRNNLRRILDGLELDKLTAKEAAKALGGLEAEMEEAGLGRYFDRAKQIFRDEYDAVQEEFEETTGKKALLGNFTRQNLNALVDTRLLLASTFVSDYIGDVRAAVLDAVVGGKAPKPEEILDVAEGRTLANLRTEINTTLMAYQRIIHQEKAKKAGIDKYLYVGPDDKITRPFCQERVGGIFTQEEIDAWDNEQGLPASIYCGGYNCRHHLRPVSDELAAELQAETTEEGEEV